MNAKAFSGKAGFPGIGAMLLIVVALFEVLRAAGDKRMRPLDPEAPVNHRGREIS